MDAKEAAHLEQQIRGLDEHKKQLQAKLDAGRRDCQHKWGDVVYDPIETKGYQDPGDPPGVGGIDHRNPMWIDGTTTKQWKRTCPKCGLVQKTQHTEKRKVTGTVPGTSGEMDVPVFPKG